MKKALVLNSNENEKREKLIDNLKILRNYNNFTQQQIADFLKVTRTTYTKYETGCSTPSIYVLKELADLYNCSLDEFFK